MPRFSPVFLLLCRTVRIPLLSDQKLWKLLFLTLQYFDGTFVGPYINPSQYLQIYCLDTKDTILSCTAGEQAHLNTPLSPIFYPCFPATLSSKNFSLENDKYLTLQKFPHHRKYNSLKKLIRCKKKHYKRRL